MELKNFIVYADMDGTMLTDWDLGPVVPDNNIAGIRRLIEQGGAFSIASGRQYKDTMAFFPPHLFNAPSVQSNGAILWDCTSDKPLKMTPIPQSCKEEMVEYTRSRPNIWLAVADQHHIFEVDFKDERDGKLRDAVRPHTSIDDFYSRDFLKACFILQSPEIMEGLEYDYERMSCSKYLNSAISAPIYFECYDKSVDKGKGVVDARKISGNEDKILVCIGDYFNDSSMLEAADIAVCPSNAPQGIKDICSIVTCSNNDGAIADLIDKLEKL